MTGGLEIFGESQLIFPGRGAAVVNIVTNPLDQHQTQPPLARGLNHFLMIDRTLFRPFKGAARIKKR